MIVFIVFDYTLELTNILLNTYIKKAIIFQIDHKVKLITYPASKKHVAW